MRAVLIFTASFVAAAVASGQNIDVRGTVEMLNSKRPGAHSSDQSSAVIWLQPVDRSVEHPAPGKSAIRQRNKKFDPNVLAVTAGSVVAFPNLDPFFHNVFSMYNGKRFDLGLYEAGTSRSVIFDHPGICYVFCNIHPEMSAAIVVLDTAYFAISNRSGDFRIPSVPSGRYTLEVWYQRGKPENPEAFPLQVTIGPDHNVLAPIRLIDSGEIVAPHMNKYDHPYETPAPASGPYH